jgi:Domain of unknown function (DUF4389)
MSDPSWGSGGPNEPQGGDVAPPPGAPGYPPGPAGPLASSGFVPPAVDPAALASDASYPVTAGLDAPLTIARWRVIGNYIMAIPHLIFLYVLQLVAEVLTLVAWFAIIFTGKLPPGIGTFIAGVHRYQWRVVSFALFLREPYPEFAIPSGYAEPGGDPAWLNIVPAQRYSRLAVIFRFILIIPHLLFGVVLGIGLYVAWIIAFFAVLITGRWPVGLRKFVVGVEFWATRVNAWYALLANDYPPFTIS